MVRPKIEFKPLEDQGKKNSKIYLETDNQEEINVAEENKGLEDSMRDDEESKKKLLKKND